jgi:hydrogenase-4 component B
VAICGLPPLNGFVSELLIYIGLFRTVDPSGGPAWASAALAAPCLALIGALAVACFVKAYGAVFLGQARSRSAAHAHEAPAAVIGPIVVLAVCCFAIGLAPMLVTPVLDRIVASWPGSGLTDSPAIGSFVPLGWIGIVGAALLGVVGLSSVLLRRRATAASTASAGTWDCGYAQPTTRMQYTSSSFAETAVRLLSAVLRPKTDRPEIQGLFPARSRFASRVDDLILDGFIVPGLRKLEQQIVRVRKFQHGRIQEYILYILVALLLLLFWILPLDEFIRRIFAR